MSLPSRWTSIFSPARSAWPTLGPEGLDRPEGRATHVVLARALYRVRWVSLADVPASERRAVARNLCLAWQPFDDSEHRIQLQPEGALLLAWDRRLQSQVTGQPTWCPESCLRQPMAGDGLRFLPLRHGFEAELWCKGHLRASRWWPQRPSEDEGQAWVRSQGRVAEGLAWPPLEEVPSQARPAWQVQDLESLSHSGSRTERLVAVALGLSLAGLGGAAGMQASHSHEQWSAARTAREAHRAAQAPLEGQAREVLAAAAEVRRFERAFDTPSALAVLAHLGPLLKPGVELRELELKGRQLRLVVTWPQGLPRSGLLQDLQAGGWLRGVKELRDGASAGAGVLAVEGELQGNRAPSAPLAQAGPVASTPSRANPDLATPRPAGPRVPA